MSASRVPRRDRSPAPPGARERREGITRVLLVTLLANLGVAAAKLVYGVRAGTLALTADGIHALVDASANVLALIAIQVAHRPPDANHPYGHRKYETVAALAIGFLLLLASVEILEAVWARWRAPRVPDVGLGGYALIAATLFANLGVVAYERRAARRLRSDLLRADAAHTLSDVFATLLVLAGLLAGRAGHAWADAVVALVVVGLVVRASTGVLRPALATLSDERRLPPERVESAAMEEAGVREVHNVRSRGTDTDIHLDLHILVDPALPLAEAHALGHRVERRLRVAWPELADVVVHVEPAFETERAHERVGGGLRADR